MKYVKLGLWLVANLLVAHLLVANLPFLPAARKTEGRITLTIISIAFALIYWRVTPEVRENFPLKSKSQNNGKDSTDISLD